MSKNRIYFYGIKLILACCLIMAGCAETSLGAASYRVNGAASATVDEWSECRNVANQTGARDTFVPTKSSLEWSEFRIHYPSHIALSACTNTLAVVKSGTGSGTVTSNPAGINCGAACSANYASGTSVTLTAAADAGSTFAGWSGGGCSGVGNCTVTLSANTTVTAIFNVVNFTFTVAKAGTGGGTVSSNPAGINCGAACSANYASGTSVTLTAAADAGSTFAGWSGGGCSGVGNCTVTLSANTTVTATFNVSVSTLTVSKIGSGTVTSNPAGINCGATCTASYSSGSVVALTATPASGSGFSGWSGDCTGGLGCSITMNSGKSVTATFLTLNSGGKRGNVAVSANNNKIYLFDDAQGGAGYLYEYDPAANSYAPKAAAMKCGFSSGAMADWGTGLKIYQIGGSSGTTPDTCTSINREYDVSSNAWSAKAAPPAPRAVAATAMVNNKIYVIGGVSSITSGSEVATNYQFDPATNTWTTKAAMPISRYWMGAAVYNNNIYVIGGHKIGQVNELKTNQQYNPSTNTWTAKAAMPTGRRALAIVSSGSYIYAIGGDINVAMPYVVSNNERYNPATNTWTTMAPMPTGRESFAAAAVNGKIYAFCGTTPSWTTTRTNEEYNTATNTWTTKAPVP